MEAVVDANVFLHGRGNYGFSKAYLVPEVAEEVKSSKGRNNLEKIDYEVRIPSEEALEKVKDKSEDINSETSEPDEKLLALAMDLDKKLVTDDIPLQNLALHMNQDFEGYFEDKLDNKYRKEVVCKNCGSSVSGESCSSCGSTRLRLRQVRCS